MARWLKKLGLIEEFLLIQVNETIGLYQVLVKKTAKSVGVPLTEVGFGVSQVLPVIVLCYYAPKGSIILFEQPEIHLHPSVQAGLADVFIDAIKTRNVQIILESHSEHLLRRLRRRIAEEDLNPEDVALYFCEFKEDQSHLEALEVDAFGNIANWPKDFFGDEFGEMAAMTSAAMKRMAAGEGAKP